MKKIFLLSLIMLLSVVSCIKDNGDDGIQINEMIMELGLSSITTSIAYDNQGRIKSITTNTPEGRILTSTVKYQTDVSANTNMAIINDNIKISYNNSNIVTKQELYTEKGILKELTTYRYNEDGKIIQSALMIANDKGEFVDPDPVIIDYVWEGDLLLKEVSGNEVRTFTYTNYENKLKISPMAINNGLAGIWIYLFSGEALVSNKCIATESYNERLISTYVDYKFNTLGAPLEYSIKSGEDVSFVKIYY